MSTFAEGRVRGRWAGLGILGFVIIAALPPRPRLAADEPRLTRFEFRQPQMGTEFQLILYTTDEPTASRASDAAFARIAELNSRLSDYDPSSELRRLCDAPHGEPLPVSEDLFRVLDRSQTMATRTGGAFDATMGPVVSLWRRARRQHRLPKAEDLQAALGLVGSDKMVLDPEKRTVLLTTPHMRLDLGGIAKGFAADEALAVLRKLGVNRALVAAAGDIAVGDPPVSEAGWSVALETPAPNGATPPALVLSNRNVSTSGDAQQFVEIDGIRYSHIVDPRTGLGVTGRSSVTIVADDGATADSLATAVSVLGPEEGLRLVESIPGAAALIVRVDDTGESTVLKSSRWPVPGKESIPESDNTSHVLKCIP